MRWAEWAAVGAAVGIVASQSGQVVAVLLLVLGVFGVLVSEWEEPILVLVAALVLGAGSAWWHESRRAVDPLAGADGLAVDVSGTVLEAPRRRTRGLAFAFLAERFEGRPELGPQRLFVELDGFPDITAGDRWRFRGKLKAPRTPDYPEGFDQAAWLRRQGIRHCLPVNRWAYANRLGPPQGWGWRAAVFRARNRVLDSFHQGLHGKERTLVAGIVLGESQGLDPELQEAFRKTGTTHLLAASGLNVAIVMALVFWVARRLGYGAHRVAFPAGLAVWFYAYLAGASPSVVRAAVMASVVLLASATGRVTDLRHSLPLAVTALLLFEPAYLYDVGFQLSVLAVIGLGTLGRGLAERLAPGLSADQRWPRLCSWLVASLAATCAATLAVLPVLAWHFQSVAPTSLVANLAMAPAAELLLPIGLLAAAFPVEPLFFVCRWLAGYLVWCAETMAAWADPWWLVRPDPVLLAGLAAAEVALFLWLSGRCARTSGALLAVALVCGLCWAPPQPPPAGMAVFRVVKLAGADVVWARQAPRAEVLWLSDEAARQRGREMLLVHGVPRFQVVVKGSSERLEFPRGLVVDGAGVSVRGLKLDLAGLPEHRPLEVVSNGERCWVKPWGSEDS